MAQKERPGWGRSPPGMCLVAGGAGGWSGHHVLRGLAGRLSSTEKSCQVGVFWLKIPGGGRGIPEGKR